MPPGRGEPINLGDDVAGCAETGLCEEKGGGDGATNRGGASARGEEGKAGRIRGGKTNGPGGGRGMFGGTKHGGTVAVGETVRVNG